MSSRISILFGLLLTLAACGTAVPEGAYHPDPFSPQFQNVSQSLSQAALAVGEYPGSYKLGAIRTSEIQAASAGAGKFYFSDGLASESREIIDGVVAHEVAHEVLGHMPQSIVTSIVVSTLFSVGGMYVPGLERANSLVNPLIVCAFGRPQELEADRKAVEILRKMGYSEPDRVMLRILTQFRDRYGSIGGGLLSSHPNIG